ncbi:hypothetical protein CPAST_c05800 [Clostridium pasteurianum DSM 525 = ATCC 6013]|uniref:Uncharacterized protein n=1 Tax=Clostridium pasteurianum DSM 525 = ATCC 6013 TaxID=1262449 RepID=A0A0H3J6T2_CLOPA|nr:hypothetical protein [Clostridium pasteurianum]AJA46680.1 hypothetical protein CPAST_c05800 [Clostridium pasteurianum DSM 525 = ATCC 6013]AJA50668.1 hypothetical protein CLPA_c05800 [Clostridium pasteurianum DSM 525 = ATCC 6013]AOZ74088.1 hypothetical protein AQ983_02785 [Clostridium pasteurianum DSM 525 = ATCC 6013]AOZ77885.1 hypothetical protein AQ984_02785 [Clostridium pasteurianum]ELP61245.1 hypothetical protein F502_02280 [Clostridium pasteurianum DSM 525 = ATCC 6013]
MNKEDAYIKNILKSLNLDRKESEELKIQFKDHISSLKKEYIDKGCNDEKATELALNDFGNENNITEMFNSGVSSDISNKKQISIVILCLYLFPFFAFLIRVAQFEMPYYRFSIINIIPLATLIPILKSIFYYGTNINTLIIPLSFLAFIPIGILIPLINVKSNIFRNNLKLYIIVILSIQAIKFIIGIGRANIDFAIIQLLGCIIGYSIHKILIKSKNIKKIVN